MSVLVLGARGRLGSALIESWSSRHAVSGLARPGLDASDLAALREHLRENSFETLVNCIAQTNVDQCERDPAEATLLNDETVGVMAEVAAEKKARLIHISTDYVFDGAQEAPYTENDAARPISHYGASKLAGERRALSASPRNVVARVSWVFGPAKPSFIDMILDRALQAPVVQAIADKTACPTSAADAAAWLEPFLDPSAPGGLYHACNTGACTWQEYGQRALDIAASLGLPLQARIVDPLLLSDMKSFVARRPVHTAMATGKLASVIGRQPRPWQEALEIYLTEKYS